MLTALPFTTIGDIASAGLELHVYCPSCYSTRRPPAAMLGRCADRCFATVRFRCSATRYTGHPCGAPGLPIIRPAELLQVGGPVTLAFLTCPRCIWEISYIRLDQPPWSGSRRRYRCPGCNTPSTAIFTVRPGDRSAPVPRRLTSKRLRCPMANPDPAATLLEEILGEADALIRRRLEESRLELPHLVVAVTADGQVVLRSNVSADVICAPGQDLIDVADKLTAPPGPDETTHWSDAGSIGRQYRKQFLPLPNGHDAAQAVGARIMDVLGFSRGPVRLHGATYEPHGGAVEAAALISHVARRPVRPAGECRHPDGSR
jgi:hypothetical protein